MGVLRALPMIGVFACHVVDPLLPLRLEWYVLYPRGPMPIDVSLSLGASSGLKMCTIRRMVTWQGTVTDLA